MTHIYIAIFIKGRGNDGSAMFLIKVWEIRSAAEKRHAERGLCNDHGFSVLL